MAEQWAWAHAQSPFFGEWQGSAVQRDFMIRLLAEAASRMLIDQGIKIQMGVLLSVDQIEALTGT